MSKRKRLGVALMSVPSILGIYGLFWVMGYWGGHKPLFSWPEAIMTFLFVMFTIGLLFFMEHEL